MEPEEYDLIVIGTGSAMNIVDPFLRMNPKARVAVIDKDEPGGICLTRGCIPTKILMYSADMVREVERAKEFGVDVEIKRVRFKEIMEHMRKTIYRDIHMIERGLSHSERIDYFRDVASFVAPYTIRVGKRLIKSGMIFLCTGSKPLIPPIKGLDKVGYLTSRDVIHMEKLPSSMVIVGGGYIAAEYGHFFSAMGSKVTIIGRNPRILPQEEPEVSKLAKRELSEHMRVMTNHEVVEVQKGLKGKKVIAVDRATGKNVAVSAEEVLIAAGRASNSDILHPEKGGIETDERGWIKVNEYLETNMPGVWAFGDANGRYLFKHVANYESKVVYYNAVLGRKVPADYHAVPSAVFTYPEIASVGMREKKAVERYGKDGVLIGFYQHKNTAKGEAIKAKDWFVKVILKKDDRKILGAHIIGPWASMLIQEVINLMYTREQDPEPIYEGMHIHPSMSEVVERAFFSIMPVEHYHQMLKQEGLE